MSNLERTLPALPDERGHPTDTTLTQIQQYPFPKQFRVGWSYVSPLITSGQLKAHLALLRAFYALRAKAEDTKFPQVPPHPSHTLKSRRWAFLVAYAVERFQTWCLSPWLKTSDQSLFPPTDVLMVWHAYRLNPAWYAEDTLRIEAVRRLERVAGKMFKKLLKQSDDRALSHLLDSSQPSEERSGQWLRLTGIPFDPFQGIFNWTHRLYNCPFCCSPGQAELLTPSGLGYLQHSFEFRCAACGDISGHDSAAVLKFARDYTRESVGLDACLAGTLHTPVNPCNKVRAKRIMKAIGTSTVVERPFFSNRCQWQSHITSKCGWSRERLFRGIGQRMQKGGPKLVARIMSAYVDDRPFSVDLVGAVMRQGTFIEKMHQLGWTRQGFFSSSVDEIALQHCIARYHAFLDLISSSPTSFFVPTLDIDLTWHTHQLLASEYSYFMMRYIRRFIDHDDKIEENNLTRAFDNTCRAWESRFNIQYSLCGCPMPGETIGQKIALHVNRFLGQIRSTPPYLLPPKREDFLAGTHSSEHNGVVLFQNRHINEERRKSRRNKRLRRQERDRAKRAEQNDKEKKNDYDFGPYFELICELVSLDPVPIDYDGANCLAMPDVVHADCSLGGCAAGGCGGGGCGGPGCGTGGGSSGGCGGGGGSSGGCGGGGGGGSG